MSTNVQTFTSMIGVTMASVVTESPNGDDRMVFTAEDGREWSFFHSQDCCESVSIDDICGDLADLVGSPILEAEEVTSEPEPEQPDPKYTPESYTWTFYRFATAKGHVTVRWFGSSNGYYSESVTYTEPRTVSP